MRAKATGVKKHPDVIVWERWLRSEEGRKCCDGSATGQYLENRLWFAFKAGMEAVQAAMNEAKKQV